MIILLKREMSEPDQRLLERLFPGPSNSIQIQNRANVSALAAEAPTGGSNKALKGIIGGGITGVIEICITYPTEYIKTWLQLVKKVGKYKGIYGTVASSQIRQMGARLVQRPLCSHLWLNPPSPLSDLAPLSSSRR